MGERELWRQVRRQTGQGDQPGHPGRSQGRERGPRHPHSVGRSGPSQPLEDPSGHDTPEATAYYRHQEVIARMAAEVRKRWGVPPEKGSK